MQNRNKLWDGWRARHRLMVRQWQGALSIQMVKYLLDHRGILDRGDDPDAAAARLAGLYVDIEDAFETLRPGHGYMALGRGFVIRFGAATVAPPTTLGRCHLRPQLVIRCEHPMESGEIHPWPWHQSG